MDGPGGGRADRPDGTVRTNLVDIEARQVTHCAVTWRDGVITAITPRPGDGRDVGHLLPGFVDAHVHLESSLLTPAEFARVAVRHGTVAAVSDPHEIANVLGIAGVRWVVDDARRTPFTVVFGAPSCVPATVHETAGATLARYSAWS